MPSGTTWAQTSNVTVADGCPSIREMVFTSAPFYWHEGSDGVAQVIEAEILGDPDKIEHRLEGMGVEILA